MNTLDLDPFKAKKILQIGAEEHEYFSLKALQKQGYAIEKLPFSIRILLENAVRNFDGFGVTKAHIETLLNWQPKGGTDDIPFKPARVLMQDFTGVPAVVDLAAIRAEVARKGKQVDLINPLIPVDLVIDHSVQIDYFGTEDSYQRNIELEYSRNRERYQLLKWAQNAFTNFSVVPPGMGICHQVNLEYLSQGVIARDGQLFPDTLVGTDSHTPMVNGIGVVGWGVGGIEAEAAILGQPIYFIMPEVIGLKLSGTLPVGSTATDLVLTVAELLRTHGVVGKFVEVFGQGLDTLSVPDRATLGNMSPEFGCTITYFPIDDKTLEYMRNSNRSDEQIERVERYCKENMLWRENEEAINYTTVLELDVSGIKPTIAGPKLPQQKILLENAKAKFGELLHGGFGRSYVEEKDRETEEELEKRFVDEGGDQIEKSNEDKTIKQIHRGKTINGLKSVWVDEERLKYKLADGSIAIAAITSCTNTSNPFVMIGAGLVARNAIKKGIDVKPWVKTSLAPGSKVVTDYLNKAGLMTDFEALQFHLVGYGCTSCIGNSGPLLPAVEQAVKDYDLVVTSVLSGNRNFEARIHPLVKMNFLMSPMLVVAFALAGRVDIDMENEALGHTRNGDPVYLRDIWPSDDEINAIMAEVLTPKYFAKNYGEIFAGNQIWQDMPVAKGNLYQWEESSTYIQEIPFFKDLPEQPAAMQNIIDARALLKLGDNTSTDHISPAGSFNETSAAGQYLISKGVKRADFNSYGSRRGNDEVMLRGTFANVRIKNQLVETEGGVTLYLPTQEEMSVYEAAKKYRENNIPLVVLGGKEYGSGSSRDWAAKGTSLLGVKAVLVDSYERIHRSNLVYMGVLPLQYLPGQNADSLSLDGTETFNITGIAEGLEPRKKVSVKAIKADGEVVSFEAEARLDSAIEVAYYQHGGILQYVLRDFLKQA
ncbi:aconitate hydratase AcnA [Marinicella litoralis]|uniref:Aconitate hydratase n=1 Tax=Marinicella litoralis TaxID=644220 RepID=A0A4R6XDP2_9GAMM|nr:aconitate hydratase AcnA [Marinicella litoralis]TDR17412.1 aconitase [Marinicella litoralis]